MGRKVICFISCLFLLDSRDMVAQWRAACDEGRGQATPFLFVPRTSPSFLTLAGHLTFSAGRGSGEVLRD